MNSAPSNGPAKVRAAQDAPVLPKRFYKTAGVDEVCEGDDVSFALALDGRPARTPAKGRLAVPSRQLAVAIAAEWDEQEEIIDPSRMPLTKLANTVIDGIVSREDRVAEEIAAFAGTDLLCYRADHPDSLVRLQAEAWDPVLDWADGEFGARLILQTGIMPIDQPERAMAAIEKIVSARDAHELGALHVLTTLSGSAILALAVHHRHISPADAWAKAHVDEDWQISQWGEDAEAHARRALREAEFLSAANYLSLHLERTTA
ncbi:MAG: ATP12 family protein [Pseudomonadota bacterium]